MWILFLMFTAVLNKGVVGNNKTVYFRIGETVTLDCEVPCDIFQWSYSNGTIIYDGKQPNPKIPSNKFDLRNDRSDEACDLQINNVTTYDERIYRCKNANTSTTSSALIYFDTMLKLKLAPSNPQILNSLSDNIINGTENEDITLSCSSDGGVPKGIIYWFNGTDVMVVTNNTISDNDIIMANYSFLLNREHNGQTYTCIVEHELLKTPLNDSVNLNIFYKPVVKVFSIPMESILLGQNVSLYCEIEGNPVPTKIVWKKDGTNVSSNLAYAIQNFSEDLAGNYSCSGKNSLGTGIQYISLLVKDPASDTDDVEDEETIRLPSVLIYIITCSCIICILGIAGGVSSYCKSDRRKISIQRRNTTQLQTYSRETAYNMQENDTSHYIEVEI